MDIAALIFAPLVLALVYCWPRIGKLPRWVLLGLPAGLMLALCLVFIVLTASVQQAITTKTPLIRQIEGLPLAFHLDGVSLLFALLITSIGAVTAFYAGTAFEEGDDDCRFVRGLLALVSMMLGLVLANHVA